MCCLSMRDVLDVMHRPIILESVYSLYVLKLFKLFSENIDGTRLFRFFLSSPPNRLK